MKTRHLFSLLPILAIATASADTIVMKDGTKYEGTVTKRDGDFYVAEIQVTKSIKDERRIPKADVAQIIAEDKTETAFTEVAALWPVPDLASAAEYQSRLNKATTFQKSYKENKHKAEVQALVDKLTKESAIVNAGGVKFEGKLITADQRKPVAYTLDSKLALANVKKLAEGDNMIATLRAWGDFERNFQGSQAYRDNVPFAITLMQSYLARVTEMGKNVDASIKRRDDGLKAMSDSQRNSSRSAIEEENAEYKRISEAEKTANQSSNQSGAKWLTMNAYVKSPIEENKRTLSSEIQRLQNFTPSTSKADEAYTTAYEAITKEGATKQDINAALGNARNAYLPKPYLDMLAEASPIPVSN